MTLRQAKISYNTKINNNDSNDQTSSNLKTSL